MGSRVKGYSSLLGIDMGTLMTICICLVAVLCSGLDVFACTDVL